MENSKKININSDLVIGLSIVRINKNTLVNLANLAKVNSTYDSLSVIIFNKSTENLSKFDFAENLTIVDIPYESLYETIMRLELTDSQNLLWLNDDDEIKFSETVSAFNPNSNTLILPTLFLNTNYGMSEVDWTSFVNGKSPKAKYEAYWALAAPIIFSSIPGNLVRIWIDYLRRLPVHLPHLDTQLNVLACFSRNVIVDPGYTYIYGAQNWENTESQISSSEKHAKSLGLPIESVLSYAIARKIDDVVVAHLAAGRGLSGAKKLRKRLLRQFTPLQGTGVNYVKRNFYTKNMKLKFINEIPKSTQELRLLELLPQPALDYFAGYRNLRNVKQLRTTLASEGLAEAMKLPPELINFWKAALT